MNWKDVGNAAPAALKLLGGALAITGAGAPAGALVSGLGVLIGHAIGQEPTPDNVAAALQDPALQEKLLELQENNKLALQQALISKDVAIMQAQAASDQAAMLDMQNARSRDVALASATGKRNVRADLILAATFVALIAAVAAMVYFKIDANTAAGGVLIMLVGKFVGNWGTAFDFEFGSSRSSQTKDATIASNAAVLANNAAATP